MKVIYGLNKSLPKGSASTIGIFDGIHRGHLLILQRLLCYTKKKNIPSLVITFHPHPLKLLRPREALPLLISLRHRLLIMERLGIDYSLLIPFDKKFSSIPPEVFVRDVLYKRLGIEIIYLGRNFRFGRGEKGDVELIKSLGKKFGFKVKIVPTLRYRNRVISSSWIREEVLAGNLNLASKLLGRPFSLYGKVIRGERRGRDLGFPTANLDIEQEAVPPNGVYIVKTFFENKAYFGLLYIGTRPTFKKELLRNVEVYLLDFEGKLYGKFLEVEFIKYLRKEKRFEDASSLALEIKKDEIYARRFIENSIVRIKKLW